MNISDFAHCCENKECPGFGQQTYAHTCWRHVSPDDMLFRKVEELQAENKQLQIDLTLARGASNHNYKLRNEAETKFVRFEATRRTVVNEAVAEEREACAKIADRHSMNADLHCDSLSTDPETGVTECLAEARGRDCLCNERREEAHAIAAMIRARTEQKEDE